MQVLSELPSALRQYLCDFESRRRRSNIVRTVGMALAGAALWMLSCCAADRLLHLDSSVRLALLAVAALWLMVVIGRSLLHLRREANWIETAEQIERYEPRFNQSLVTAVSRAAGPPAHRGSEEILAHLLHDLDLRIRSERRPRLAAPRVALPWLCLLLLGVCALELHQISSFGLSELAQRFAMPWAQVPPVTTTRLQVSPGDQDLVQAGTLRVVAEAERLGGQPLWLYGGSEGSWARFIMSPAGTGKYAFTFTGVDRDMRYYLEGGDARTRQFMVRVLRRPAVDQFRIHFVFPAYTGKPPMTVISTDGVIEAPVGTQARLTVCASEPLQSALLTAGSEKILMRRTDNPSIREAELVIRKDLHCELDMISTREVAGSGPMTMKIQAIADHPPVVRLVQAGQNLRLNPRDIVPLTFDVIDDFGISGLSVHSQVNASKVVQTPIPLSGDRRRQEGSIDFDLAARPLNIGDLLTLTLVATDTSGQVTASEPVRVLVSPRSIDMETHQRIAELQSAFQLATLLVDELTAGDKGLAEADGIADKQSAAYTQASSRTNRRLASASENATLLRQAIFRATLRCHEPELAQTLAGWIDIAQILSDSADDLFRRGGRSVGAGSVPRERLQQALERGRQLVGQIQVVVQGEQAQAALADRENLNASEQKAPPAGTPGQERLAESLRRAREDIAATARELGIDPGAGDLEGRLKAKVETAQSLARSQHSVDFASAAHEWSQELQRSPRQRVSLEDRLSAAAEAEAIRPDADLPLARDLQLASRAAASIESSAARQPVNAGLTNEFAAAMAALQREHESRRPLEKHSPEELAVIHRAAAKAREQLTQWAPDVEDPSAVAASPAVSLRKPSRHEERGAGAPAAARAGTAGESAEELALAASAAAAARDYAASAALDQELIKRLSEGQKPGAAAKPLAGAAPDAAAQARAAEQRVDERVERRIQQQKAQVAHSMQTARTIDGIGSQQEALARQTITAPASTPQIAGEQRQVAEDIARVAAADGAAPSSAPGADSPADSDWRGRATQTLLAVQEQLTAMPQRLSDLQQAAQGAHDAAMRAAVASQTVASAPADQKLSAERAARQAATDAQDAAARLERVCGPVSVAMADSIAAQLAPFAPEAASAREKVVQQLSPVLARLSASAHSGDAPVLERAAGEARSAIEAIQRELARAQDAFTERDPLHAAKWFARAAADSLSRQPPDLRTAQNHQVRAGAALARAWDHSIHEAAARRLASVPSLQSVYAPDLSQTTASGLAPTASTPGFAAARQWGRLRPRDEDSVNLVIRESDPAGYEESLKLYFEALGNAQEGKGN